jgi:protein-S-isoprenylcysteine O-methyltransferase Ste14
VDAGETIDLQFLARLVVGAAAVALLAVGLGVLAWEARRPRGDPLRHEHGLLSLVNFVGILGFVGIGLATALTLRGTLPAPPGAVDPAIRLLGIAVVVAAGFLALWGLRSIGGAMSSQAEVGADAALVTTGAFSLVRHPLYLSILLLWAGASLALWSWLMALCTILLVPAFVARSRLEERLLVDHFGDAYRQYADHVPMLVPWFHGR